MKSKCKDDTKYDRTTLYGLPAIAAYLGYTPQTIRRWKSKHGFPLYKMPDGVWQTSTELIDRWGMARENVRLDNREV